MREWIMNDAYRDVPLVTLAMLMLASLWMIVCASRNPGGMVGRMLQDEAGKPSVLRLVVLWGFIAATWVVMKSSLRPDGVDASVFAIYVGGTFGAHVAVKVGEKWNGIFPWAKP